MCETFSHNNSCANAYRATVDSLMRMKTPVNVTHSMKRVCACTYIDVTTRSEFGVSHMSPLTRAFSCIHNAPKFEWL